MAFIHDEGVPVAKVRALPAGTEIYLNGFDRYGMHWTLRGTIVQSGKRKMFRYEDTDGLSRIVPIIKTGNRWWTMEAKYVIR